MHYRSWQSRSLLLFGVSVGLLLLWLAYANWGRVSVPFTSLAHDQNLGRPFSRYLLNVPDLLVITDPTDIDQLAAYFGQGASPNQMPLHVIETLRQQQYDRDFALLILQGVSGGSAQVTVQQIIHQGKRVIVQAEFVTARPGEGQTANVTDAYDLVTLPKADFRGQQLHFELWDGWQRLKEVDASVGDLPPAPGWPTVTPFLPPEPTLRPTSDAPAMRPDQHVPETAYPAPTVASYP